MSGYPLAATAGAAHAARPAGRHAVTAIFLNPLDGRTVLKQFGMRRLGWLGRQGRVLLAQFWPGLPGEHGARAQPDTLAAVAAIGAEALGVDRRGAASERGAAIGARFLLLFSRAVQAATALTGTSVLHAAGVIRY